MIKNLNLVLALFLFFFAPQAFSVTLTPVNHGGYKIINGIDTYYFPIEGPNTGDCIPANQRLSRSDLSTISPTGTVGLVFDVRAEKDLVTIRGATPDSDDISIRVEQNNDSSYAVPLLDYSNGYNDVSPYYVSYGTTDYATKRIGISLADNPNGRNGNGFCDLMAVLNSSFTCQPTTNDLINKVTVKIGIVRTANNFTDTNSDFRTIDLYLLSCPPGISSSSVIAPTLSFKPVAGDKRVKIENTSTQPYENPNVGIEKTLVYSKKGTLSTYGSADRKDAISGNSPYYIENLENDSDYCFSLGYVNYAGFVTTGTGWGESSLPAIQCARPSQIDGFLDRSSCFIASSVYENENDPRLEILRQFRDQILLQSNAGKGFVKWYYSWSPAVAKWMYGHPHLKMGLKIVFAPIVEMAELTLKLKSVRGDQK